MRTIGLYWAVLGCCGSTTVKNYAIVSSIAKTTIVSNAKTTIVSSAKTTIISIDIL